ncbi:hypothetical protein QEH56_23665 [Pelagicoccus enzymogenes]|uniref:hypothetical protein n=1 Tax=Pelagicoccus enzymogenes TaxID=2773457 RepID=UPI00280D3A22|nr:hypothetical protein [Pelagicoccus enzymogenes]MDQ8201184.1 hypothetical protein [Pelagicoccus enzymogenes]
MAANAQDEDFDESETFTLNPFVIEGETGTWNATETLAGSRLKSDLSDVPSQIEVMTMDFMDAFDVNSIDEAAIYSVNMESPQEGTGNGISGFADDTLRIRGISGGTRSREFFATGVPTDNYNLTRVDIASGPNAILFGTGSASGSINSTLSRATVGERFGDMELQVDSWGGVRFEIDYNLPIGEKVAIRVAGLNDRDSFELDGANQRNKRFYGTVTWKPTEKITMSAHAEFFERLDKRPSRTVPLDSFSTWFESSEILQAAGFVDAQNPNIPNETLFDNSLDWLNNDNRALVGNEDRLYNLAGPQITVMSGPVAGSLAPRSWNGSVDVERPAPGSGFGLYEEVNLNNNGISVLSDEYIDRNLNTVLNLKSNRQSGHVLNYFFNQEVFENFYVDAGIAKERVGLFGVDAMEFNNAQQIHVDPNRYLPGTNEVNPLAGQLYMDGRSDYDRGYSESLEWRVAASYEYDLSKRFDSKWLKWLGTHRVAGMYLDRKQEGLEQGYRYHFLPKMIDGQFRDGNWAGYPYNGLDTRRAISGLGVPGVSGDTQSGAFSLDGTREMWLRTYIGGPGTNLTPQLPAGFSPGKAFTLVDLDGVQWTLDPENAALATNGDRLVSGDAANGIKQYLETSQFTWQGYFWDGRIVTSIGRRTDTLNTTEDDVNSNLEWMHPETGEIFGAQSMQFNPHISNATFLPYDDALEATGDTEYEGIVLHPFRNWGDFRLPFGADLSLSYSESNTFQPNTTEREPDGNFIPGETGDGEDRGVTLSLFDGRFRVKYNEYETLAGPTKMFLPFRRYRFEWRTAAMRDVMQSLVNSDKEIFDMYFPNPEDWPLRDRPETDQDNLYPFGVRGGGFATGNFQNYADPYTFTADTKAEGKEVSVFWQPTKNLSLRATWNDQEVVQSNLGELWFQFEDEFFEIMDRTKFIEGYVPGAFNNRGSDPAGTDLDGLDLDPNDGLAPGIDYFTWEDIPWGGGNGNQMTILPWGQHDGAVTGGWTRPTMKEQTEARLVNSNIGSSVLKAFDGQPNDFLRNNRMNLNVRYRFSEGKLKGLSVAGAMRYRAGAGIGVGVQEVNGQVVPDTSIIMKGPDEQFFDLSLRYFGRGDLFGLLGSERDYNVGLTVRNVTDEGPFEVESADFYTGAPTGYLRVEGRQFIFSAGVDF